MVWDQLEQSRADRAVSTRKKQIPWQTGCTGMCLLSQHSVNRARRPELKGRLGHIVKTAHPQKIRKENQNQKKEKARETALVRLRQVGDSECKASLSYSETLPTNKPIKRLLSEMHGQDEDIPTMESDPLVCRHLQ